jgi:VWFA-related protein
MVKFRSVAALAMLCALGSPAGAQTSTPNRETAPSETVIRARAYEVALDLVVRDKKGRLVKNLTPADIEIYEDGMRQQIRSFRLVTGSSAPGEAAAASGPTPTPDAVTQPMALPDLNLVCLVFHNLDSTTRKWAIAAAQEFIKTQLQPGTFVGVFNLSSRLTPLYRFTTNRDELLRAANNAFVGTSVDITRAAEAVLNSTPNVQLYVGTGNASAVQDLSTTGSLSMTAITGADVDNGPGANSQRGDLVLEREQFIGVEGARQMDQIQAMIRQFDGYPGHKTVLLFSTGLTTTGDPDQFQAMVNRANAAGISVYAFDANGLNETSTAQASPMALQHVTALSQQQGQISPGQPNGPVPNTSSIGTGGVMMERARQGDYQQAAVRTSDPQAALRALAEDTGGFLVANSGDLRKPFQQIGGELETHYEAHYRPSSDKYDGQFRKIEVKLGRADWRAEWRQGYFAIPDRISSGKLQPFEIAGLMALNSKPRPQAFPFRSAAFQFRPGADSQVAIVFELPGSALTATPVATQKKHFLHASLFAMVKDAEGQIADSFGQDFQYAVPDDQLVRIQAMPIDYRHVFNLPPGHYTLESVLLDREAKAERAGTSTVAFDIAEPKGVVLSSPMVVARADPLTAQPEADDPLVFHDRELVPMLNASLTASAQPMLYFVVYPDKSIQERPRIRVEFLVDGEALTQKETELPAPDSSGAIPVLVNAATKAGHCEIRITVLQGFQSVTGSIRYTVAAQ